MKFSPVEWIVLVLAVPLLADAFSTPFFLFVFPPLFMMLYWLSPARRAVLLPGSSDLLLCVKYTAFSVENLNRALKFAGMAEFPAPKIALPLGPIDLRSSLI